MVEETSLLFPHMFFQWNPLLLHLFLLQNLTLMTNQVFKLWFLYFWINYNFDFLELFPINYSNYLTLRKFILKILFFFHSILVLCILNIVTLNTLEFKWHVLQDKEVKARGSIDISELFWHDWLVICLYDIFIWILISLYVYNLKSNHDQFMISFYF